MLSDEQIRKLTVPEAYNLSIIKQKSDMNKPDEIRIQESESDKSRESSNKHDDGVEEKFDAVKELP